ncbi:MAG: autotransporter-associated beta strand repeat-containing protein [Planctomycetota bacterium]|nr:autotransporter-associated beta strand repeat-containing protein [Planctomycetota bacterium]
MKNIQLSSVGSSKLKNQKWNQLKARRRAIYRSIFVGAILSFGASSLQAQTNNLYWDADANTSAAIGGTGSWDTTTSLWRSVSETGALGTWTNAGPDNNAFLKGTAGTLTLTTGISVNDITVDPSSAGTYVITGAQTLSLGGATQSAIDVASGSTLTVSSGLAGLNGFTKSSAGTLILDGAAGTNGLFGPISVTGGTLQAGSATNNGASQVLRSNAVNLASGTTLTTVGTTIDLRVGSLSGSGSVTPATGGAINILARENNATFSGTITTTGGLNLRGGNGTTQTFSGNLTALTGTIGINSGATMTLIGTGDSTSGVLGALALATRGGTLTLDNSGGNTSAATGRVADAAAVSMLGGRLQLIGNSAGSSETVGAVTFNDGANTISVTNNGGTGAQLTFTDSGSLRDSLAMVINFASSGTGTLGAAGNNSRITFTGTPITITGGTSAPLGMFANTATGATVGFATVNGTEWAGYGANGVVALTPSAAPTTATNLAALTATSMAVFSPTATVTASGNVTTGTLKITPNGGTTLAMGASNLATTALMLAGTTDFSITGTGGALNGGATKYIHVTDANTTLSTSLIMSGSNQPFTKAGSGFLDLNRTSTQFTPTNATGGGMNIVSGVLRGSLLSLGGGTSAGGALTTINLRGGVLEISGGGTFSRAIDLTGAAGGGGITFDSGGSARGDGGFSAISGNATVNLVTAIGGVTAASLVWNDGLFLSNGYALTMGSTKADSVITLSNNIGLDDGTAATNYFAREIRVADNTLSTSDVARLSGVISGSANADLLKTGAGVLELTNTNTYSGNTLIQQGTLIATGGTAISNTSAVVLSNTAGATFQLNNSETIGALSGGGTAGGNVALQTNTLTVGDQRDSTFAGIISSTTSAGGLVKQGIGTLTLTGVNTFTGGTSVNVGSLIVSSTGSLASGNAVTIGASGTANFANVGQTLGAVSNANTATDALNFSAGSGLVTLASLSGAGNTRFGSAGTVTGGVSEGTVTSVGALNANITGGTVTAGGLLTGNISIGTVGAGSLSSSAVSGGAVTVTGLSTIGTLSGSGTLGSGSLSATTVSGGTNTITGAAGITTVSGGTTTVGGVATIGTMSSGTVTLNGANSSTITTLNGGSVNLGNSGTALTVSNGTSSGSISGSGSLTKDTTGTLAISGSIAAPGGINVNAGKLAVNGAASGGQLIVASNATLAGGGTIGNATTINGTHSPGNSAGIQSFTSGVSYTSSSTFEWELFSNTSDFSDRGTSTGFDGVNVSGGTLDVVSGAKSKLLFGGTIEWTQAFWNSTQTWTVFTSGTTSAPLSVFDIVSPVLDSQGNTLLASRGSFSWAVAPNNNIVLNYTAVPEPTSLVFGVGLGITGVVTAYRRRGKKKR